MVLAHNRTLHGHQLLLKNQTMWALERGKRTVEKDIETTPQLGSYCAPSSLNWIHDSLREFKPRGNNALAQGYNGFQARKALAPKIVVLSKIGRHERGPKGPDKKTLKELEKQRLKEVQEKFPVPSDWKELRALRKAREKREADDKEAAEERVYLKKVADREALEEREVKISEKERRRRRKEANEGFFSVWDGIGTARSASPARRKVIQKQIMDKEKKKNDEMADPTGRSPSMLLKAMNFETEEAAKVAQLNPSDIGLRLNDRAQGLRLWYEEKSDSKAGPAVPIPRYILGRKPPPSDLELCRPSTSFVRLPIPIQYRAPNRLTAEDQKKSLEKGGFGYKDKLLDYQVLADSCKRSHDSSRLLDEGRAVLCMAVLYDNCQDYPKAIENYERFLDICRRVEDKEGQALAYNCMGCSLQEAQTVKHALHDEEVATQTDDIIEYEQAMQHHIKHAEMADLQGKFVAFTNLGFISMKLGKWNDAAQFFKKALKCCTTLENPQEQAIALSSLGFLLFRRDKMLAAKACMSRYLQICRLLNDQVGQARAHFTLGNIAFRMERHLEARTEYNAALKYAKRTGNRQVETFSKVQLGIVEGNIKMATQAKLKAVENQQKEEELAETSSRAAAEEDIDVTRLSLNLGGLEVQTPEQPPSSSSEHGLSSDAQSPSQKPSDGQ